MAGVHRSKQTSEDQWEVRRESAHSSGKQKQTMEPGIDYTCSNTTEHVTPGSGFTATADAASQAQTNPWCILHCPPRKKDANSNNNYSYR